MPDRSEWTREASPRGSKGKGRASKGSTSRHTAADETDKTTAGSVSGEKEYDSNGGNPKLDSKSTMKPKPNDARGVRSNANGGSFSRKSSIETAKSDEGSSTQTNKSTVSFEAGDKSSVSSRSLTGNDDGSEDEMDLLAIRGRAPTFQGSNLFDEIGSSLLGRTASGSFSSSYTDGSQSGLGSRVRSRAATKATFSDVPEDSAPSPFESTERSSANTRKLTPPAGQGAGPGGIETVPLSTDRDWQNRVTRIVELLRQNPLLPQCPWSPRLSVSETEKILRILPPKEMWSIRGKDKLEPKDVEALHKEVQNYIDGCEQGKFISDLLVEFTAVESEEVKIYPGEPTDYLEVLLHEMPHPLFREYFHLDEEPEKRPSFSRMKVEAIIVDYQANATPKQKPIQRQWSKKQRDDLVEELVKLRSISEFSDDLKYPTEEQIKSVLAAKEGRYGNEPIKPAHFDLLKKLSMVETTYEFNPLPQTYDYDKDQYYPKLSPGLLDAIRHYHEYRQSNASAVAQAEDPSHSAVVSKELHRQLVHGMQLENNVLNSHLDSAMSQAAKRGVQLHHAHQEITAYKALLKTIYSEILEDKDSIPLSASSIAELGLERSRAVVHSLLFPHATENAYSAPKPKTDDIGRCLDLSPDDDQGKRDYPMFARKDLPSIAKQTQHMALKLKGKMHLRRGEWEDALASFVDAKKAAREIQIPQLEAAVCLWQGVAWMGLSEWDTAEQSFSRVWGCNGIFEEAELVQGWVEKLREARKKGGFELWGRWWWSRGEVGGLEAGAKGKGKEKGKEVANGMKKFQRSPFAGLPNGTSSIDWSKTAAGGAKAEPMADGRFPNGNRNLANGSGRLGPDRFKSQKPWGHKIGNGVDEKYDSLDDLERLPPHEMFTQGLLRRKEERYRIHQLEEEDRLNFRRSLRKARNNEARRMG
ncbi:MAG: hypothetical protein MMC23_006349 [Stictis urceolatum]|nr:hypothetical protein [Stictis urceolata]